MPASGAFHKVGFVFPALVDVRIAAAVPAKHLPALRTRFFGILVHPEFRVASHVIVLLSFSAFPFSWPPLPHLRLAEDASGFTLTRKTPNTFFIEGFGFLFYFGYIINIILIMCQELF